MAETTKIEWTEATWNPITGCTVISPGCTNCYAMKLAGTRMKSHPSRAGLTRDSKAGPVWNGQVRLNEEWLTQPLQWKRPRMIFVCAHGDLFHESVPDEWIDKVFAVMALAPQHTFQVLTKRSRRMREYLASRSLPDEKGNAADDIRVNMTAWVATPSWREKHPIVAAMIPMGRFCAKIAWPLPNVWLGVSVEDQARADERIPDLLATPAAVRWISAEPLLGPVDVSPYLFIYTHADDVTLEESPEHIVPTLPWRDPATTPPHEISSPRLDWVVVGGESGNGARPMHPDWARSLRDQCADAGVPFFFKQWGEYREVYTERPESIEDDSDRADELYASAVNPSFIQWDGTHIRNRDDLPWDEDNAARLIERIGKARAGRLLDGIEHNGMPRGAA